MAGVFLSLDGIDGTGKTTQLERLATKLRHQGYTVTACIDPGGTELGARLRDLLLHARQTSICPRAEALLFMASRAELVETVIRPALARGDVVLSDRFTLANLVYQGHAADGPLEELRQIGRFATAGLTPHLTLVLDLPVEVALLRRGRDPDRMESRGLEYAQRVRAGFLAEAERMPERIRVVDASGTVDSVHEYLMQIVTAVLRNALAGPP
jgi:dTMP kinase